MEDMIGIICDTYSSQNYLMFDEGDPLRKMLNQGGPDYFRENIIRTKLYEDYSGLYDEAHQDTLRNISTSNLMEMLAQAKLTISSIRREIPAFEVLHKAVPCSWDKKGQTMRNAIEYSKGKKTELIDGVKIFLDNGWVLLLPDPDEAYFHVWAEAKDKPTAQGFINIYTDKIREWQK